MDCDFKRKLRNISRVNYADFPDLNPDEYIYCNACKDFVYEYCSIHGPLLIVRDDHVPNGAEVTISTSRAALTIPSLFLYIAPSTIPGAGSGIFASRTLPVGVRFGPYRGLCTDRLTSDYCWQIHGPDGNPLHLVDGSRTSSSNWMRYVNCSRHCSEQNLAAFQYRGDIYYRTLKIIPANKELLVFYGTYFARKLGIKLEKYNSSKFIDQNLELSIPKSENIASSKEVNEQQVSLQKSVPTKKRAYVLPLKCEICHTRFAQKKSLRDHLQFVHIQNSKGVKCDVCNFTCNFKPHLDRHKHLHDMSRKYECGICHYRYTRRDYLNDHLQNFHQSFDVKDAIVHDNIPQPRNCEKKAICDVCHNTLSSNSSLKRHLRAVHKIRITE